MVTQQTQEAVPGPVQTGQKHSEVLLQEAEKAGSQRIPPPCG